MRKVIGGGGVALVAALVIHAISGVAFASIQPAVPEIDGGAIASGIGALAAGWLVLRAYRSR